MNIEEIKSKLIVLYDDIAAHSKPKCAACIIPFSCCDSMYCNIAKEIAKTEYGIELKEKGHPKLPFMGENGCVVPPYLRPLCSLHTCRVNGVGMEPNDPEWNKKYFELRGRIEELEGERFMKKHNLE